MLNRKRLARRRKMVPWKIQGVVRLYRRLKKSQFDTAIQCTDVEKRQVSRADEKLFEGIEGNSQRRTFFLGVDDMTPAMSDPEDVQPEWVIKEPDGAEWVIVDAKLEMMDTRIRCQCLKLLGEKIFT